MNNVSLVGRFTRDPELKQTSSGLSVCSFTLAVDRPMNKDQADFINCVAWRTTAEFICHYFSKGSRMGCTGSIQTRTYKDKNDNNRTAVEVVVDRVEFVESKSGKEIAQASAPAQTGPQSIEDFQEIEDEDDLPF